MTKPVTPAIPLSLTPAHIFEQMSSRLLNDAASATSGAAPARIVTHYNPTPVPDRSFDWSAYDDTTYGGDEGDLIGYGATEQEAIDDLKTQMEER